MCVKSCNYEHMRKKNPNAQGLTHAYVFCLLYLKYILATKLLSAQCFFINLRDIKVNIYLYFFK